LSKPDVISWYSDTGKCLNCLCKAVPQNKVHLQKVPLAAVTADKLRILPAQLCQVLFGCGFFFPYTYIGKALKYKAAPRMLLPKNKMNKQSLFCLRPSKILSKPQRCCDLAVHKQTGLTDPQLHQQS